MGDNVDTPVAPTIKRVKRLEDGGDDLDIGGDVAAEREAESGDEEESDDSCGTIENNGANRRGGDDDDDDDDEEDSASEWEEGQEAIGNREGDDDDDSDEWEEVVDTRKGRQWVTHPSPGPPADTEKERSNEEGNGDM